MRGDAIFPQSLFGRFAVLCAILRQLALVLSTALFSSELRQLRPDVIFVDQLSVCIPFFRILYPRVKILFYGHYPDRLLAQEGKGLSRHLKRLYRIPFDLLEGWSTGYADGVAVNSKFTRSVFRATFPKMRGRDLKVIYPCVDANSIQDIGNEVPSLFPGKKVLLSINRFEGKKNLDLALRAYAGLSVDERSKAKLVIAGGYDPRNAENANTHKHLQTLAVSLNLTHATFRSNDTQSTDLTTEDVDVLFLPSVSAGLKTRLLHSTLR